MVDRIGREIQITKAHLQIKKANIYTVNIVDLKKSKIRTEHIVTNTIVTMTALIIMDSDSESEFTTDR